MILCKQFAWSRTEVEQVTCFHRGNSNVTPSAPTFVILKSRWDQEPSQHPLLCGSPFLIQFGKYAVSERLQFAQKPRHF